VPPVTEALPRPTRGRPRHGPATRGQILDSSLRLFSDRGYARTSVRDIAQAVGITDAAIYYHFASKRDLLHSLFEERGFVAALEELEGLKPGPDAEEQLQAVSVHALRIISRNRDLMKVLLVEGLGEDRAALEEWRLAADRWVRAVTRLIATYVERGVLEGDADVAATCLVNAVLGAYLDGLMAGDGVSAAGEPAPRLVAQVRFAVSGCVRALAP
jgi:AcrR family transcriptional regulator